jgi:hypothetical protein
MVRVEDDDTVETRRRIKVAERELLEPWTDGARGFRTTDAASSWVVTGHMLGNTTSRWDDHRE